MAKLKKCKLCGDPTPYVMNINFKAVPICNNCGNTIFLQQATWLAQKSAEFSKLEIEKYEQERTNKST